MKRIMLAAGVAALALSAQAAADPGKNESRKGGGDKARSAKVERGGGDRAERRVEARRDNVKRRMEARREGAKRVAEVRRERSKKLAERRRESDKRLIEARREDSKRIAENRRESAKRFAEDRREALQRRAELRRDRDVVRFRDRDDDDRFDRRLASRGLIDGCPPGLFKKNNGCLPPGQARKLIGQRVSDEYRLSALPKSLRNIYRDNDDYTYRYRDNYVYRVDRDSQIVSSLLPLLGAGLGLGQMFPSTYANAYVPNSYRSFYPDTRDDYYRYANGYVYEIDRSSGLIEGMVPLMASGYGVGQMLPAGYSAYNVPYQYRDRYYDTDEAYYRYAPGAIYQVDPQTNLISSVASLLSPNGFAVGQPLPAGYGTYNVPYQYRDDYYDTADNMYRYNNGNIYRIDPTTQLITALVRAIV